MARASLVARQWRNKPPMALENALSLTSAIAEKSRINSKGYRPENVFSPPNSITLCFQPSSATNRLTATPLCTQ